MNLTGVTCVAWMRTMCCSAEDYGFMDAYVHWMLGQLCLLHLFACVVISH